MTVTRRALQLRRRGKFMNHSQWSCQDHTAVQRWFSLAMITWGGWMFPTWRSEKALKFNLVCRSLIYLLSQYPRLAPRGICHSIRVQWRIRRLISRFRAEFGSFPAWGRILVATSEDSSAITYTNRGKKLSHRTFRLLTVNALDGNLFSFFPLSPDQLWSEISFRAWPSIHGSLLCCLSINAMSLP